MEAALRALLTGAGSLTDLVPASRIVWNHLPQATTRPAIVLYRINGAQGLTMRGGDGLTESIVQIDVQALSVSSMWAIRDQLVELLHGHRDETFQAIFQESERQTGEDQTGGGLIHRASLDFTVWSRKAAA
jgi:hypothetical protein